jgi:hypothetical protein
VTTVALEEDPMRVTSNGKVRRSVAEWQMICAQVAQSGLGPKEFCQREAIALGSFRKWHQRYSTKGTLSEAFVELVPPRVQREPWAVKVFH